MGSVQVLGVERFRAVPRRSVSKPSNSSSTKGIGSGMIRLSRKRPRTIRNSVGERRPEA
jgi:hypothetical protein